MLPREPHLLNRRRALGLLGVGLLAACAKNSSTTSTAASTTAASTTAASATAASTTATADCTTATPAETGGPFPADGSNDDGAGEVANVLDDPGVVRSDMRSNQDGSDTQPGVPMTLSVNVTAKDGCTPLAGAAVYVWHCNKDGHYSVYSGRMNGGDYSGTNWLRAVQVTGSDGTATFQSILPGRYQGRAFHIHYEVFADANYSNKLMTSQMAADDAIVEQLYAAAGADYASALANVTLNARDNVFADGVEHQLLTISGDVSSGVTAVCHAVV